MFCFTLVCHDLYCYVLLCIVMCCFVFQQEWLFRAIQQWCVPVKMDYFNYICAQNNFKSKYNAMSILILVDVLLKMLVFADIFLEKKIAENQFHSSSLKNIITYKY